MSHEYQTAFLAAVESTAAEQGAKLSKIERILAMVVAERVRQDRLLAQGTIPYNCTDPNLPWGVKVSILGEEYGEVCRALNENSPVSHLRDELVQTAAVCVAWIESLDETEPQKQPGLLDDLLGLLGQ